VELVVIGFAVIAALACAPSARVEGPLAPALAEALARRGVVVPPAAGCPAVTVAVSPEGSGVRVAQPPEPAQVVPDLETAALLVETWVRADLIDPLLAARRGPPQPTARRLSLGAAFEGAASSDGAGWAGARVEGCIELGPVCTGVRLRALYDPGARGQSAEDEVWRLGLNVLATGDLPLGPLMVGLGAGVSVVRVDGQRGQDDTQGAPLFEGRVAYGIPMGDALALDLSLGGTLTLWPRHGRANQGDETPGLSPWMALAGLGLRWTGR
jgi:hypothetical protein